MIAKVISMSNYTSMVLFSFPALVLSIFSITMELIGLTLQFAHAQRRETLPFRPSIIQSPLPFSCRCQSERTFRKAGVCFNIALGQGCIKSKVSQKLSTGIVTLVNKSPLYLQWLNMHSTSFKSSINPPKKHKTPVPFLKLLSYTSQHILMSLIIFIGFSIHPLIHSVSTLQHSKGTKNCTMHSLTGTRTRTFQVIIIIITLLYTEFKKLPPIYIEAVY